MVPGYKKIKDISQGPLTNVILARQESLERNILLKILHPQHVQDKEIVERFIREAKLYAKLKHDNIVNVIDLGKENGSYYIAMEYVDGYSLDKFIKKYAPIPLDISVYIFQQLLTGLQIAHESGIIHRDIKPSNILIGKNGDIKITDFGLARPLNLSAITEQGNILGTPAYLAPEIVKSESANFLSDVFSLGASIYELLTSESFFNGDTVGETIANILNKKPVALTKRRTDIPEWLSELVLKMMDKKPQRRPESCIRIIEEVKKNANIISKEKFYNYINDIEKNLSGEIKTVIKKSKKRSNILYLPIAASVIIFIFFFYYNFLNSSNGLNQFESNQKSEDQNNQIVEDSTILISKTETEVLTPKVSKNQTINKSSISLNKNNASVKKILEKTPSIDTKENGSIFINAIPWAEIYINNKKIDTTPLLKSIELIPGTYELELKNPDFVSYKNEINIQSGKNDSLTVKLKQAFGNLKLTIVPWGKIYINNQYVDTSPVLKPIKLKTGRNELDIINPNYAKHTEILNIRSGETLEKTIYLSN